jgi:hypothetical protein
LGHIVQEEAVRGDVIVPLALIACFEFGRKQDPFVYPELISPRLPLIAGQGEPYRIAVHFFQNKDVALQPHLDAANMANRFESTEDADGRTVRMHASHWDNALLPLAVIHEISLEFEYKP